MGPILGAVPGILVVLATDPTQVIWVVLLYIGVQMVENTLLVPRVQGRAVSLPPRAHHGADCASQRAGRVCRPADSCACLPRYHEMCLSTCTGALRRKSGVKRRSECPLAPSPGSLSRLVGQGEDMVRVPVRPRVSDEGTAPPARRHPARRPPAPLSDPGGRLLLVDCR